MTGMRCEMQLNWTAGIHMKWRCDHRSCNRNINLSNCKIWNSEAMGSNPVRWSPLKIFFGLKICNCLNHLYSRNSNQLHVKRYYLVYKESLQSSLSCRYRWCSWECKHFHALYSLEFSNLLAKIKVVVPWICGVQEIWQYSEE